MQNITDLPSLCDVLTTQSGTFFSELSTNYAMRLKVASIVMTHFSELRELRYRLPSRILKRVTSAIGFECSQFGMKKYMDIASAIFQIPRNPIATSVKDCSHAYMENGRVHSLPISAKGFVGAIFLTRMCVHHPDFYVHSEELLIAIFIRDLQKVSSLLRQNILLNSGLTENRYTALHIATLLGDLQLVLMLIDAGALLEIRTSYGKTALNLATFEGDTALMEALIDAGANINAIDASGKTPLICSVIEGYSDAVELLIERHANVDVKDSMGLTAIMHSLQLSSLSIFIRFENHRLLPDRNSDAGFALYRYARQGPHVDIAERVKPDLELMLHEASHNGNVELVQICIEEQVNLDSLSPERGITPLFAACTLGNKDVVKLLLQAGANPNIPNQKGLTPLARMCIQREDELVKILLQAGANPNIPNQKGLTPLASMCIQGVDEIVKILLQGGANPDITCSDEMTPFDYAVKHGKSEIIKTFIKLAKSPTVGSPEWERAYSLASKWGKINVIYILRNFKAYEKELLPAKRRKTMN